MAIYHMQTKIIGRSNGSSIVAAAAYRSAKRLHSDEDNHDKDYTKKAYEVVYSQIHLPDNAHTKYQNRETLWNAVAAKESKSNSQLAREIIIALPVELTQRENISLVEKYAKENFVDKGMIADINIHDKKDGNPHAHILLTVRPFDARGEWAEKQKKIYKLDKDGQKIYDPVKQTYKCATQKITNWDKRETLELWRETWAKEINHELKRKGIEPVSHLSYEKQGLDKIPTIHMGSKANSLEKKGIPTERGEHNRLVQKLNQKYERKKLVIAYELRQVQEASDQLTQYVEKEYFTPKQTEPEKPDLIRELETFNDKLEKELSGDNCEDPKLYHEKLAEFEKRSKLQVDFYLEQRTQIYDNKVNQVFHSYLNEWRLATNKKITGYRQQLERLEQEKPRSFLGINKKAVYSWERTCNAATQELRQAESYRKEIETPQWERSVKHEIDRQITGAKFDEIENSALAELSTEKVRKIKEAKRIYELNSRIGQNVTKLQTRYNAKQRELERSRAQSRGRGR